MFCRHPKCYQGHQSCAINIFPKRNSIRHDSSYYFQRGGDRSEVGGRIGLGKGRTDEVEVENGK